MENKTNNGAQDSNPNEDETSVPVTNSDKMKKEDEKKANLPNNTDSNSPGKPPLLVEVIKQKGWTKQDFIGIAGVIISTILFVITLKTFHQTKRSVDISEKAVELTNKQFAILNEPLLGLGGDIGLSNWRNLDSFSIVTLRIYNMSHRPIKIDTCVFGIRYDTSEVRDIFLERDRNIYVFTNPAYVLFEYPKEYKFDTPIRNSREYISALNKKINTFFGVIFYRNYMNDKRRYYIFSVRVATSDSCCTQHVAEIYMTQNQDTLPHYASELFPK